MGTRSLTHWRIVVNIEFNAFFDDRSSIKTLPSDFIVKWQT
ncbi:MAG: hypothetical protein ABI995_08805 [Acidobacteriota bacterium]